VNDKKLVAFISPIMCKKLLLGKKKFRGYKRLLKKNIEYGKTLERIFPQ